MPNHTQNQRTNPTGPAVGDGDRNPVAAAASQPQATCVEIHDLTVAYDRKPVLWDVDVALPAQRLIAIVGPNGAGKSTLLKAMLGLVPLASGEISIFGKPPNQARSLIGYVPQRETDKPRQEHQS